jgi:hypothetical protein
MRQPFWCLVISALLTIALELHLEVSLHAQQPATNLVSTNTLPSESVSGFIQQQCIDCHSADSPEGGFDLTSYATQVPTQKDLEVWIKIHDRVVSGEMPPKNNLTKEQVLPISKTLFDQLVELDRQAILPTGRSVWRRMNRYEYENSLRDLLSAPWLQLKTILPEDGEQQRFNKIGEALDTSHVNLARYMQAADYALREVAAKQSQAPERKVTRYYAREDGGFKGKLRFGEFNRSPERAVFPLIDYEADLEALNAEKPRYTVGDADPQQRERESFGVVASSYEPIELRFSAFKAPVAGRYMLRFKGYTFWAAGDDKKWWRPVREKTSIGRRSEPVAIYSVSPPRQLRKLGEFDFQIEPSIQELDVYLLKGESIQPDAVRLFRSRPPNFRNPLAEKDGMPGVAFSYMEADGPIHDQWPTAGQKKLFGDLQVSKTASGFSVESKEPIEDAKRLLSNFLKAAYHRHGKMKTEPMALVTGDDVAKNYQPATEANGNGLGKTALPSGHNRSVEAAELDRFLKVVNAALESQLSFQEAMFAGYTAILCSPEFLCLEERVGPLEDSAIATRLSLFLWNSLPDAELRQLAREGKLTDKATLKKQVHRLLDDKRSMQFIDAFLAYWLDLRKINDTSPDERLYPDYYLDDSLVDGALNETQLFVRELIRENLPARNLVDSDFSFLNERLAQHYQIPGVQGVAMRRVALPEGSPRGGILTQASILKVTANGTTTSPVVRGAWVNERILGIKNPPPPKSVPAVEPDTRGATTIRQQLELHRADTSCNSCHEIIDPVGFALENFDVSGGWRDHYRSLGDEGDLIAGVGKNGQPFTFRKGPPVDASGNLPNGKAFSDINQVKKLLVDDERAIAKNMLQQLAVFATGTPMRFSDRIEVDQMLDRLSKNDYRVQSMIIEIVTSNLFLNK